MLTALMSVPFGKSILMVGEDVMSSLKVVVTRTTSLSFTLSSESSVTIDTTVGGLLIYKENKSEQSETNRPLLPIVIDLRISLGSSDLAVAQKSKNE